MYLTEQISVKQLQKSGKTPIDKFNNWMVCPGLNVLFHKNFKQEMEIPEDRIPDTINYP